MDIKIGQRTYAILTLPCPPLITAQWGRTRHPYLPFITVQWGIIRLCVPEVGDRCIGTGATGVSL